MRSTILLSFCLAAWVSAPALAQPGQLAEKTPAAAAATPATGGRPGATAPSAAAVQLPAAAKPDAAPAGQLAPGLAPMAVLPPSPVPAPPIAAKSYLLVDLTSGQSLVVQNADERRDPASLTKLMTAYLAFEALKQKQITPSQMVPVSDRAWRAEGSRMFIEPRKPVTVDELLR